MNLFTSLSGRFASLVTENSRVYNLQGSSAALLLALRDEPFVALEKDEQSAERLRQDIAFYRSLFPGKRVLFLPDPEGPESSGIRASVMYEMADGDSLVTSSRNLVTRAWGKETLGGRILALKKGGQILRSAVREALIGLGYRESSMVVETGEFSQRGWIIDVFPSTLQDPVRIEFFGDEIEVIKFFDIETQRSKEGIEEISIFPAQDADDDRKLADMMTGRRWYCLYAPQDREGLPEGTVFLSRYAFEYGAADNEADSDFLSSLRQTDAGTLSLKGLGILPPERKGIEYLPEILQGISREDRVIIVSSSAGQAERLQDLFREKEIILPLIDASSLVSFEGTISVTVGGLSAGAHLPGLMVLTEKEIFGERHPHKLMKKSRIANLLASLDDIVPGDFVVHREHGVGRFSGIVRQHTDAAELELMLIEYLDGRLYIPIQHIEVLSKYRSEEGVFPRPDKLGGKTWEKKKARARKRVNELAEKLLGLYAGRKVARGFTFSIDTELHREFDGFFPYEETPDQRSAISEIKKDMESEKPMDRLLCGDVGYGKTEVAMRAAFKAVYDSRQVAVLVPTTILAEQHFRNFRERFSGFPVKIDYISRFKSRKEIHCTLKALAQGEIDIIIGTHALLSRKVTFHALGLLVVDEEHKFGVGQKERVKEMSRNVDVLNMTATPIPRSLHMALSGIRDISVIETPPEERLTVKTMVSSYSDNLIRDVASRELDRNGQVFFVHNRIQDIYRICHRIQELVPSAKIVVAHGQMPEKELEEVMHKFFEGVVDVLVSTAIIGSGLDIPRANTIIVNRADKMGLADLYQLRGRVGRGNLRGYAYFIIPGESLMSEEAKKRIQAIQEMSYLGAGFRLALKDLEIRGAGNIFGPEQSGHIHEIGFDLYIEMLEKAVAELKGEVIEEEKEPVVDITISAFIPEKYVDDVMIRMSLYRRISSCREEKDVTDLLAEFRDRFGEVPQETVNLLDIMKLKILARQLSVLKVQEHLGGIRVFFSPGTPVQPQQVLNLYERRKEQIKFLPDGFELAAGTRGFRGVIDDVHDSLDELRKNAFAS